MGVDDDDDKNVKDAPSSSLKKTPNTSKKRHKKRVTLPDQSTNTTPSTKPGKSPVASHTRSAKKTKRKNKRVSSGSSVKTTPARATEDGQQAEEGIAALPPPPPDEGASSSTPQASGVSPVATHTRSGRKKRKKTKEDNVEHEQDAPKPEGDQAQGAIPTQAPAAKPQTEDEEAQPPPPLGANAPPAVPEAKTSPPPPPQAKTLRPGVSPVSTHTRSSRKKKRKKSNEKEQEEASVSKVDQQAQYEEAQPPEAASSAQAAVAEAKTSLPTPPTAGTQTPGRSLVSTHTRSSRKKKTKGGEQEEEEEEALPSEADQQANVVEDADVKQQAESGDGEAVEEELPDAEEKAKVSSIISTDNTDDEDNIQMDVDDEDHENEEQDEEEEEKEKGRVTDEEDERAMSVSAEIVPKHTKKTKFRKEKVSKKQKHKQTNEPSNKFFSPHDMPPLPQPPKWLRRPHQHHQGRGGRNRHDTPSSSKQTSHSIPEERHHHHHPAAPQARSPSSSSPFASPAASQAPKQIDVTVHRIRHLSYQPSSIVRLAATPHHPLASDYLALSRSNGCVELRSVDEKWRTVGKVRGLRDRIVDCLCWTTTPPPLDTNSTDTEDDYATFDDSRLDVAYASSHHQSHARVHARRKLYGASGDGTIFEVDFVKGRHTNVISCGGGAVFSLVSLCGSKGCCKVNQGSKGREGDGGCQGLIAAGCEDGSVRIYKRSTTEEGGKLELLSTLPPAGSSILSIAWTPGMNGGMVGSTLYAGVADGTIRRYDCQTTDNTSKSGSGGSSISTGSVLADASYQWRSILRMTLPSESRTTPTRIWSLAATTMTTAHGNDSTQLFSADSLGNIHIWDGLTGTVIETFRQNNSGADVLDVVLTDDGTKAFCSGVDSRVMCIEYDNSSQRWYATGAQRPHTHDVRSLAIVHMSDPEGCLVNRREQEGKGPMELLCSGSVDTKLCTYTTWNFGGGKSGGGGGGYNHRPMRWFPWPESDVLVLAKRRRVMAMLRESRGIDLYRLGKRLQQPQIMEDNRTLPVLVNEEKTKLTTIDIQTLYNLMCHDISDDGKFLAVSDASSLMLFRLEYEGLDDDDDGDEYGDDASCIPTMIPLPKEAQGPCTALKFVPSLENSGGTGDDGVVLCCATAEGPIAILRLQDETENEEDDEQDVRVEVVHTFKEHMPGRGANEEGDDITRVGGGGGAGPLLFPVTTLDVSPDGRWLASGRNGVGNGCVHVFALKGPTTTTTSTTSKEEGGTSDGDNQKDGNNDHVTAHYYRHWYPLPALEAPHSCIKFLGGGKDVDAALCVGCTNLAFYIFDVERKRLSDWSQDSGFPISTSLPEELIKRKDYPVRFAFNGATPNKFLMGSFGAFCAIDLDLPVPTKCKFFPERHVRGKRVMPKRPRSGSQITDDDDEPTEEEHDPNLPLTRRKRKYSNSDTSGSDDRGMQHGNNFTICLRYNGMLFMDFVDDNEMVVVEQPWLSVVSSLPDPLERKVYGS